MAQTIIPRYGEEDTDENELQSREPVSFHKHCQITVLAACGVPSGMGATWWKLSGSTFENLPPGWLNNFSGNTDLTDDICGILKTIDNVSGRMGLFNVRFVDKNDSIVQDRMFNLGGDPSNVYTFDLGRTIKFKFNDITPVSVDTMPANTDSQVVDLGEVLGMKHLEIYAGRDHIILDTYAPMQQDVQIDLADVISDVIQMPEQEHYAHDYNYIPAWDVASGTDFDSDGYCRIDVSPAKDSHIYRITSSDNLSIYVNSSSYQGYGYQGDYAIGFELHITNSSSQDNQFRIQSAQGYGVVPLTDNTTLFANQTTVIAVRICGYESKVMYSTAYQY